MNPDTLDQARRRAESLLDSMRLEEKIAQLSAYMFFDTFWNTHATYDEQARIDFIQSIGAEEIIPAEGLGFVTTQLRDLPPALAARQANADEERARTATRHGIPAAIHDEGVHGLIGNGTTVFPTALALAATFDEELMGRVADAIGREARSRGVRQLLSPTLNLARDPRVGRVEETYGESPVLAACMGVAFIRAVQAHGVVCTPKHFIANFEADGGRDSAAAYPSERHLRETLLPPFEAAVREGGALSLMCAYNSLDGIPCAGNHWLLTRVLREEWDFQGYVVADYHAVVHQWELHGTVADKAEAAANALHAGLDVELPRFDCFGAPLREALERGLITKEDIDRAAQRVLTVKAAIGLLDDARADEDAAEAAHRCAEHLELAREAACRSLVLLKNEGGILPLDAQNLRKIAVIGPNADALEMGDYSWDLLTRDQVVTPLAGLREEFGERVRYAEGCAIAGDATSGIEAAVKLAAECEIAVFIGGSSLAEAGEARDRRDLKLSGVQEELILALARTGMPLVVVLYSGGIHTVEAWHAQAGAILHGWYAGEQGGRALAQVLTGREEPSGRLPLTVPAHVGQCPVTHDMKPSGRGHTYEHLGVLGGIRYPFGFGLTYTTFDYSQLELPKSSLWAGDVLRVALTLRNAGAREGSELVQLYVRDPLACVVRPLKELKAWKRVWLEAGAESRVVFELPVKALEFPGPDLRPLLEPGEIHVMIGPHASDLRLRGSVWLAPHRSSSNG